MNDFANPWVRKQREKIYENPWITLYEDQVINPAGKPGIYGKVSFKNKALAIIPLDEADHTWLVGQYRYTLDRYSWELPMGGVPHHEDILSGAQRELREETGIRAAKWTQIIKLHTSNCVTDEIGYTFLAQELTIGATQRDETEQLKLKRIHFEEVIEMVMDGQITDAISVASVLKYAAIRK